MKKIRIRPLWTGVKEKTKNWDWTKVCGIVMGVLLFGAICLCAWNMNTVIKEQEEQISGLDKAIVELQKERDELKEEKERLNDTVVEQGDKIGDLEGKIDQMEQEYAIYSSHQKSSTQQYIDNSTGGRLTMSGGVYYNPNTGLKETWYSQKVLAGGGLRIPDRHINEEGFVCDGDGYICVASSDLAWGTVVETSRGMGKVYDSGCASGVVDLYTDW